MVKFYRLPVAVLALRLVMSSLRDSSDAAEAGRYQASASAARG